MSDREPVDPVAAALAAFVLAVVAVACDATLPLDRYSDPNDKLGLIVRVVIIGLAMWGCYRLFRSTRGWGRAVPLGALIAIALLMVNTAVWALS